MSNPNSKKFYITTTLPYVNSDPHIGFAMELIRADMIARYKKLQGFDVFFNTGTDEHGAKIFKKAEERKITPQEYVDEYAEKFKALIPLLGISKDIVFTRTTDKHHIEAAKEFWKLCDKNGFIYKKNYMINYCVGCELEKSNSELVNGKCPDHPNLDIECREEENYFFKFSVFQFKLSELYKNNPEFVIPNHRLNEIKAFVDRGLQDFSISRLKSKMPWGIEVPGDPTQVMYVWFDALVNYISAIGWPDDMKKFNTWHNKDNGMVQYCGKDNLRQQASMWQAMLLAADLPVSKTIVIDGFVTGAGGVKMSKSLGNTIDPADIVSEYGTDALRYYVAREISPFEDTPFTKEMFKDAYNANLANGIGNLVSRVMTMAQNNLEKPVSLGKIELDEDIKREIEKYDLQKAVNIIWKKIGELDLRIQTSEPFKLVKTDKEKAKEIIKELVQGVYEVAVCLEVILPETSERIKKLVKENKKPEVPLFVRKD
ncbi:MAG: methionine--tRNA ligase [Candidatus Paceibacterota bacterium]|jgi:methionyl-tRNA synthetase